MRSVSPRVRFACVCVCVCVCACVKSCCKQEPQAATNSCRLYEICQPKGKICVCVYMRVCEILVSQELQNPRNQRLPKKKYSTAHKHITCWKGQCYWLQLIDHNLILHTGGAALYSLGRCWQNLPNLSLPFLTPSIPSTYPTLLAARGWWHTLLLIPSPAITLPSLHSIHFSVRILAGTIKSPVHSHPTLPLSHCTSSTRDAPLPPSFPTFCRRMLAARESRELRVWMAVSRRLCSCTVMGLLGMMEITCRCCSRSRTIRS